MLAAFILKNRTGTMNFIVVGAGAVGSYIGGRLAAAGEKVSLVGRLRTIEPIAQDGLTVTDLDGFNAHVPDDQLHLATNLAAAWYQIQSKNKTAATSNQATIVLLCVKGGATVAAAKDIANHLPAGTLVVSLQNGVDNVARIQQTAPDMQALAGMVPYNVVMKTPSHVHRATTGRLQIAHSEPSHESPDGSSVSDEIARRFNAAGLSMRVSTDMRAVQWGKLLLNLNNPINALSSLPLRDQLLNRDFRKVLAALQLEALEVMTRAGIEPVQLAVTKPKVLPRVLKLPTWIFKRLASRMLRMDASARSSMWDDVQHNRSTEIDDMCGAVVRLASQHQTIAPRNAALCTLMAQHTKEQHWTGKELRKALKI